MEDLKGKMYIVVYYALGQTHCCHMNYECLQSYLSKSDIKISSIFNPSDDLVDRFRKIKE